MGGRSPSLPDPARAPSSRYHFEDVGGMQEARALQVDSVQPLLSENLALRSYCQEAWVLSGKQQVAKENHQVRARECEIPGGVMGGALGGGVR